MPHGYNLRDNPKRKVIFSPVSEPKRINLNRSVLPEISETMDYSHSNVSHDPENPNGVPMAQAPANPHLNADRPPFVPGRGPLFPNGPPPFQNVPPPNVNGQFHGNHSNSAPPPNDSNLARHIQHAISEGMRSAMMNENRNMAHMIHAVHNLADLIDRRLGSSNNPRRESTRRHEEQASGSHTQNNDEQNAPEENNAVSRLERMVHNLSLQISSINDRLNSSHSVPQAQPQPQAQHNPNLGYSYRLPLDKWQIKFNGEKNCKLSGDDFLNILSLKRETHDVTWSLIGAHFDNFLEGKALDWYYRYRTVNPRAEWLDLKTSFLQKFGRSEDDADIIVKISSRKQGEKESFDDFCDAMLELRSRLNNQNDFPDDRIIGFLRRNCKLGIRRMIATFKPDNLTNFIDQCNRCDKIEPDQPQYYSQRRVHEIQHEFPNNLEAPQVQAYPILTQTNPSSVEALRSHINNSQVVKCWNCDETGHRWMECGKDRMSTFCYRCGNKNVTCVNCDRCKNFRVQEIVSGESPQPPFFPDLNFPHLC